ncbi:Protein trichome birefringence [Rhynchospora pubera]|uniref:Protein trichome birefringence n=1 Tax=Rhynchospora pubera TaxID=906938 RepID=A0AAV8G2K8_9POAL|nr:Protein trichome birefringence [Rhynchospora pubera]
MDIFSSSLRLPSYLSIPPFEKLEDSMGMNYHYNQNNQPCPNFPTKRLITWVIYALIPLALLHFYIFPIFPSPNPPLITETTLENPKLINPQPQDKEAKLQLQPTQPQCDYFNGNWVKSTIEPLYNGTSCGTIKKGQNCMVHGRPDTGYLYWRWKPENCEIPPFDPASFLELIANRHIAFIGDSMARNQLESLLCLLATKSQPELVYRDSEENKFRRWVFKDYNTTVSVFWSPFLVKGLEKSAASGLSHNNLYLDVADEKWASELNKFDIMIFSIGHWFLHPAIYYEGENVLGCHHCPEFNHTEIGFFGVFQKAISTTLKRVKEELNGSDKLVVVTTFSPAHFEGEWDKAGACPKKEPYKLGEKDMEYMDTEMRRVQIEEVTTMAKEVEAVQGRLKIEALDVTKLAMMRPDGHPGPYMNRNPFAEGKKERVPNDCVHWCMPGPIDSWNEILLEIVKRWSH